jgi:L-amino acid N-acyltransferase YncA
MSQDINARYPRDIETESVTITLRLMTVDDHEAVLAFARQLPRHDLLFLRRDISEERVMKAWEREIKSGEITSLVALSGDEVVGCSAVVHDAHSFSPHVGDVRVVLANGERAHGLGRVLVQESFLVALSLGLEKLTAHMTTDQEAAINVFEDLGFRPEALFKDHVRDADGKDFDLMVLSHDVALVQGKLDLYGVSEAMIGDG